MLILGALAIASVLVSGIATAQSSKHSQIKAKPSAKPHAAAICESPTLKPAQSSPTAFSAHTVTLKWNPNVVSAGYGKPDGYCLYRSQTPRDVLLKNKCKECELLNQTPLPDPTCVDKTVADGQTYYYAVAAVNAAGMSGPSNETPAVIRTDKPPTAPPTGIPLCQAANVLEKSEHPRKE